MTVVAEGFWDGRAAWESQLDRWAVSSVVHRRLISEAALCGKLLTESWYEDLALISDDAPQFKLFGFVHGLCWVHGERKINRLIPLATTHITAKERAHSVFWEIYADLKAYRHNYITEAGPRHSGRKKSLDRARPVRAVAARKQRQKHRIGANPAAV